MGAISFNIEHNIHGRFVTCQRPIIFTVYCNDVSVIYFKARMVIKNMAEDWIETDVIVKGYQDSDFNYYSFNVAEYVRNYFELSELWMNQDACGSVFNMFKKQFQRDFKFHIWPVVLDSNGISQELTDQIGYTRSFAVVELNTKNNEITCAEPDNKIRIDNFVNGTCDGEFYDNTFGEVDYLGSEYHRPMTNMPGWTPAYADDYAGPLNVLNTQDGWFDNFIISPWNYQANKFQRIRYGLRNATTQTYTYYDVDTVFGCPLTYANYEGVDNELMYYNLNLDFIDNLLTDQEGPGNYVFSNADNSLVIDRLRIKINTRTATGLYRNGGEYTFKVTDKKDDGKCGRRTKFIFKNMRGGIDWFHCYGTEKRSVDLKSTQYDQNQSLSRGEKSFAIISGEHSTTNVWTKRTESFSVFSQPLTTEWVKWLEELIVSPQVWVEIEQENLHSDIEFPKNKTLVPIVIDTGSYKTYSSENGTHFIEFKYKLSDNTLTQIGY